MPAKLVLNNLSVSPVTQVVDDVHNATVAKAVEPTGVSLPALSTASSFVAVGVSNLHTPSMSLSPEDTHVSTVRKGTSLTLSTAMSFMQCISTELDAILQTHPPALSRQDAFVNTHPSFPDVGTMP